MEKDLLDIIKNNIEEEPYVKLFNIKVVDLKEGYSLVEMKPDKKYENIFSIIHGGAIFSLIDVAFGSASNSYGNVAVALSMNINYITPALSGKLLRAEARELKRGRKVAVYNIIATNDNNEVIASCQAVAYLKNEKLPFLK